MRISLAFIALCAVPLACLAAPTETVVDPETLRQSRAVVSVVTADKSRFDVRVELARSDEERARGLMYRRKLGVDDGMLFIFPNETVQAFWMKNTYIPLDMIFIKADGTIAGVVENATPETETPRTIGKPSRYVLEVNGGWAKRNGVKTGDRVELQDAIAQGNKH